MQTVKLITEKLQDFNTSNFLIEEKDLSKKIIRLEESLCSLISKIEMVEYIQKKS